MRAFREKLIEFIHGSLIFYEIKLFKSEAFLYPLEPGPRFSKFRIKGND